MSLPYTPTQYTWQEHIFFILTLHREKRLSRSEYAFCRMYLMPYCAHHTPAHRFILLNRHYKPLNHLTYTHVDYDDPQYQWCTLPPTFDPLSPLFSALHNGSSTPRAQALYFYSDKDTPLRAPYKAQYLDRLVRFMDKIDRLPT